MWETQNHHTFTPLVNNILVVDAHIPSNKEIHADISCFQDSTLISFQNQTLTNIPKIELLRMKQLYLLLISNSEPYIKQRTNIRGFLVPCDTDTLGCQSTNVSIYSKSHSELLTPIYQQ